MKKKISLQLTKEQANSALNQIGSAATAFDECQVWLTGDNKGGVFLEIEGKESKDVQANIQQSNREGSNSFTPPKA